MTDARAALERFPRVDLGHWPTPLERCDRLDPAGRLWVKRDDCSGLAGGGNKTRKLEYLLGAALTAGADGVVTFGALQSNHARQTAAACNRLGLTCDLVLTRAVPRDDEHYLRSGNLLLDRILGATVHVVDGAEAGSTRVAELFDAAAAAGRSLFAIGPGGSDPIGALGYVAATFELAEQAAAQGCDPGLLVVAASTCGTAAGLIVGAAAAGLDAVVEVACVYRPAAETAATIRELVAATAALVGIPPPADDRWWVTDAALGDGYGVPSPAGRQAIERLARSEGILLDPVYTGKAFAHVLDRPPAAGAGTRPDLVFVHTGGSPGVFAYVRAFD